MPCTTILVGKNATYDGSTLIARNDDGFFDAKKLVVVEPEKQPRKYKSKIGQLEIELPDDPLRYSCTPSVNDHRGIWAAAGINSANVGMSATETITSNPLVMGADPYVRFKKAEKRGEKDIPGGIGEEDLVVIVLPYVKTAREGVERLGMLLEKYGTYEPNGNAFNDEKEAWWLETIGGHHWMARRVPDDAYVIAPNQLGIDFFDFEDAFGEKKDFMCSPDLKEFVEKNHLNLNHEDEDFNPRWVFGSHSDSDHVYNTPRAWFMARYFNPTDFVWDGEYVDYKPESDDIPWCFVPEKKITVEDVKYVLSSYYQGTPYNPYSNVAHAEKGMYRPIGVAKTGTMAVLQIRPYVPEEIKGVEWICFGCNAFNAALAVYTNVPKMPDYLSKTTLDVDSNTFYWASRLIGVMADKDFGTAIQHVERYQAAIANQGHQIINEYDQKMIETKNFALASEANEKLCAMARKESTNTMNRLILNASQHMKVNYARTDN